MIRQPRKSLFILCASMIFALSWASVAPSASWAGDCDEDSNGKSGQSEGKFHIEERNGQKVYVIDNAITVCGKVPRPLVAYVLQARSINYEWETLKQDFLPKILNSVKKAPF